MEVVVADCPAGADHDCANLILHAQLDHAWVRGHVQDDLGDRLADQPVAVAELHQIHSLPIVDPSLIADIYQLLEHVHRLEQELPFASHKVSMDLVELGHICSQFHGVFDYAVDYLIFLISCS